MACAFRPPCVICFGSYDTEREHYREWVRAQIDAMERGSTDDLHRKAFLFWKWRVLNCNLPRDKLHERVDTALLRYFHHRGVLTFLADVSPVPCSHKNQYKLCVCTRYGVVEREFSSVREVRQATGLDFRKELRKILYK